MKITHAANLFAKESIDRLEDIREELENSIDQAPNHEIMEIIRKDILDLEIKSRKIGNQKLNRQLNRLRVRLHHLSYRPHFLHVDEVIYNLNTIDSITKTLIPLRKAS